MRKSQLSLGVFAVLALQSTVAAMDAPPELGTLFYTVTQRLEISRARRPEASSEKSDVTYLQGVVRRSRGNGTVWLNGESLPEGQSRTPPIKGVDAVVDGKRLRVGQSVNKSSGARSDIVAPGAVTLGSPK